MEEIIVTNRQVFRAATLYDFDELNNSIMSGDSNIYGAIGEIVAFDYLSNRGVVVSHSSTFDYDITANKSTIDVKTKRTTVEPRPDYNCSIASFNPNQKCQYYLFVRVSQCLSKAWILGYIGKAEFFNKATLNKEGESDGKGFKFKCDCYNLKISELIPF